MNCMIFFHSQRLPLPSPITIPNKQTCWKVPRYQVTSVSMQEETLLPQPSPLAAEPQPTNPSHQLWTLVAQGCSNTCKGAAFCIALDNLRHFFQGRRTWPTSVLERHQPLSPLLGLSKLGWDSPGKILLFSLVFKAAHLASSLHAS